MPTTTTADTSHVNEDIWAKILFFLHVPIPPPLSRPSRDALLQPDLAAACLTSRLLRQIATPLLYGSIATDRFPSLISNLDITFPTSPLRYTKRLSIEYREKLHDVTYLELLDFGEVTWIFCGSPSPTERKTLRMMRCEGEVCDMAAAMEHVGDGGFGEAMPQPKTVAVSSIWGKNDEDWNDYKEYSARVDNPDTFTSTADCMLDFQYNLSLSTATHLCFRDICGPLSIPETAEEVPLGPGPAISVHFGSLYDMPAGLGGHVNGVPNCLSSTVATDDLPLALGRDVRWVSDLGPDEDFASLALHASDRTRAVAQRRRIQSRDKRNTVKPAPESAIKLEIFASSPYCVAQDEPAHLSGATIAQLGINTLPSRTQAQKCPLTDGQQQQLVEMREKEIMKSLRDDQGKYDKVSWRVCAETPICAACGSGPPPSGGGQTQG